MKGTTWNARELAMVRSQAKLIHGGELSYYRAMKVLHAAMPWRTEEACRTKLKAAVAKLKSNGGA